MPIPDRKPENLGVIRAWVALEEIEGLQSRPFLEIVAMTERSVFPAALDIDDPAERATYLAQACAGDPALREQVEQLLKANQESAPFMERPAPRLVATV